VERRARNQAIARTRRRTLAVPKVLRHELRDGRGADVCDGLTPPSQPCTEVLDRRQVASNDRASVSTATQVLHEGQQLISQDVALEPSADSSTPEDSFEHGALPSAHPRGGKLPSVMLSLSSCAASKHHRATPKAD
jgi:hypothetical protein